jgi:hypothetical protein
VVELVDAPDSKSGSERSVGSIPTARTTDLTDQIGVEHLVRIGLVEADRAGLPATGKSEPVRPIRLAQVGDGKPMMVGVRRCARHRRGPNPPVRSSSTRMASRRISRRRRIEIHPPKPRGAPEQAILVEDDARFDQRRPGQEVGEALRGRGDMRRGSP